MIGFKVSCFENDHWVRIVTIGIKIAYPIPDWSLNILLLESGFLLNMIGIEHGLDYTMLSIINLSL
jgi:hypothetical protein